MSMTRENSVLRCLCCERPFGALVGGYCQECNQSYNWLEDTSLSDDEWAARFERLLTTVIELPEVPRECVRLLTVMYWKTRELRMLLRDDA